MSSKNSCHVCQSLYVCFLAHSWSSDTAQQVTCMVRSSLHSFECLSLVSSYVGGSVFFSHPTRSSRRKLTKLIHNIPAFHHLTQLCDNLHEHEPWGQKPDGSWATAEETAYPWPLARAIAAQVLLQLQDLGVECHLPSFAEQEATLRQPPISSLVKTYLHSCQNLSKSPPKWIPPHCHLVPGNSALPNGGMSRSGNYRYSLLSRGVRT